MRLAYQYRQTQTSAAGAEIAAAGSKTFTFTIPGNAGQVRRISIERTAGDCVSFDWKLLSTASADASVKTLNQLDSGATVTPGAGIDLDSSYADGAKVFSNYENAAKLYVVITANGGTGGNLFTIYLYTELGGGNTDSVTIST